MPLPLWVAGIGKPIVTGIIDAIKSKRQTGGLADKFANLATNGLGSKAIAPSPEKEEKKEVSTKTQTWIVIGLAGVALLLTAIGVFKK